VNGTNTLSLTSVTVSNNEAPNGDGGGFALQNYNGENGSVTVMDCTIDGNVTTENVSEGIGGNGGGIAVENIPGPTLTTISNTTVSNNTASLLGGGIFLNTAGSVCLIPCVPGPLVYMTLNLHSVTVGPNNRAVTGGGIWAAN
jgi:hypothetical protein